MGAVVGRNSSVLDLGCGSGYDAAATGGRGGGWQQYQAHVAASTGLQPNTRTLAKGMRPDLFDESAKIVGEVKYVRRLYATAQIKGYAALANQLGYSLNLYYNAAKTIQISNTIRVMHASGVLNLIEIAW